MKIKIVLALFILVGKTLSAVAAEWYDPKEGESGSNRSYSSAGPADMPWTGNLNLYLGKKYLSDSNFKEDGTQVQPEWSGSIDLRPENWWVNMIVGYSSSEKSNTIDGPTFSFGPTKISGTDKTEELRFGLRKYWAQTPRFTPFVGLGAARISLTTDVDVIDARSGGHLGSATIEAEKTGFWFEAGASSTFFHHWNVGIAGSYSTADATVEDIPGTMDLGGLHWSVFTGLHW